MSNHYETLGVAKEATPEEIKKAYRKLASKHHPDKGGDTKQFQDIQVAHDTLSDIKKREVYNMQLEGRGNGPQFHFHTNMGGGGGMEDAMFDILRRQFGFGGGMGPDPFAHMRGGQQRAPQNRDVRISLTMDLVDTLSEQTKTLNITLPGNMKEDIEIKIPRGVPHGGTMRYAGLGDHSVPNAPRADLYVQFQVRPHPSFGQSGIDLVTPLTINCLEAIVGCEKEVTGLDGKKFKITVPPGTQNEMRFGIPDQGLYSMDHPGRGRLVVQLDIYIPKELTEEQMQLIRSIQATL